MYLNIALVNLSTSFLKMLNFCSTAKQYGNVMGWEDMMNLGKNEPDTEIIQREKNQAVNKACMYIYTSGTTGPPKGMCNPNRALLQLYLIP